ncbi:MAG: aminotransferase class I/II-fold pyridoxal phosphate-dependent enzyme [bacterium]|nr:aminotransferase class I/II-fold pyridoxal phosphate-dependent enzyme [bacterium]
MSSHINPKWSFPTLAVHGFGGTDPRTGAVAQPIYQTSTFAFRDTDHGAALFAGTETGFIYSRISNPTVQALEQELAFLEQGEVAACFGSGMAAISAILFAFCKSGDNYVVTSPVYGGTHGLGLKVMPRFAIEPRERPCNDLAAVEAAIDDRTRILLVETPANPTIRLVDIEACVQIAKRHNILLVVDNTFATPYLQQPLVMGADIVMHSATKYIGGHGDVVAGIVVTSKALMEEIRVIEHEVGGIMSPFSAYLLLRGLKTLAVRMDRHCENAQKVAQYLAFHPKVAEVWYPGLTTHPEHALAKKQMLKFGGMVSFVLKGGRDAGKTVLDNVILATNAVSLGDCDTLIVHPASTTHSSYTEDELKVAGLDVGLVRLSVGIESYQDIIDDLGQALQKV